MKPGIVCPNPLGDELECCPRAAEAGAKAVVARPRLFVDEGFSLRVAPEALAESLSGAGLELAGLWAEEPLVGEGGDDSAGSAHIRSSLDLVDALRDHAPQDALPVVVFDAGSGLRADLWPKLVEAVKALAAYAEERQAVLAVRPDRDSLVDRARNAAKLLVEAGSAYVQVALDAAATVGDKDTLDDAIERLKGNIVLAFARDVKFDGEGHASYHPPGSGVLNFPRYVELLSGAPGCRCLIVGELAAADDAKAALEQVAKLVG